MDTGHRWQAKKSTLWLTGWSQKRRVIPPPPEAQAAQLLSIAYDSRGGVNAYRLAIYKKRTHNFCRVRVYIAAAREG